MTAKKKPSLPDLEWYDVRDWGFEGKGWNDTQHYYERLPRRAEKSLPDIWKFSRHGTGFSCEFETNASQIYSRKSLLLKQLDEPNMNRATFSGLDLYAKDKEIWRWAGVVHENTSPRSTDLIAEKMKPIRRHFRLYFPLRNPVLRLEIGVPKDASFKPIAPRKIKPIVYYGSSIVHGAFASRAGTIHASVLGRWLNRPVINLGFSGQAKMHEPLAPLLAELDPAVFVLDPLPNMDPALVQERAEPFIRTLSLARPTTPIVLVEDFPVTHAWIRRSLLQEHQLKWKAFNRIYHKMRKEGFSNLRYVEGLHSIGDDNMGTVDGVHPNDLGYDRLARHLVEPLRQVLQCPQSTV